MGQGLPRGVRQPHRPMSWNQRAWAAVLYAWPAALAGSSALRAHGLRGHDSQDAIQVVVCHSRKVTSRAEVKVERTVDFDRVTQLHLAPPRVRVEHALLRVASKARTDDGAVAVLADGCQSGRTTPPRLSEELTHLPKLNVAPCCPRSSTTSRRARCRRWSADTCATSSERTGCPSAGDRDPSTWTAAPCDAMSSTRRQPCWSSSMVASATSGRLTAGKTWTATSTRRQRTADHPSGLATGAAALSLGPGTRVDPLVARLDRTCATVRPGMRSRPIPGRSSSAGAGDLPRTSHHKPDGPASNSNLKPASSSTGTPRLTRPCRPWSRGCRRRRRSRSSSTPTTRPCHRGRGSPPWRRRARTPRASRSPRSSAPRGCARSDASRSSSIAHPGRAATCRRSRGASRPLEPLAHRCGDGRADPLGSGELLDGRRSIASM